MSKKKPLESQEDAVEIQKSTKETIVGLNPEFAQQILDYLGTRPSAEVGHLYLSLSQVKPFEITINQK